MIAAYRQTRITSQLDLSEGWQSHNTVLHSSNETGNSCNSCYDEGTTNIVPFLIIFAKGRTCFYLCQTVCLSARSNGLG